MESTLRNSIQNVTLLLCTALLVLAKPLDAQQNVVFKASDGTKIYGMYYPSNVKSAAIILLFHQAESSHWEYAPIVPRLVEAGFSCLAIDQRSGDDMWGQKNQTVEHLGKSAAYLNALPDLEAALEWARGQDQKRPVILWGSSYSASLVFLVAAKHTGEIAGLLAFSPGEYFADKHMIEEAATKVNVPVLVTSAKDRDEVKEARSIFQQLPNKQKSLQYVPKAAGVHGSSALRKDRDPDGAAEYWEAVTAFLQQFRR